MVESFKEKVKEKVEDPAVKKEPEVKVKREGNVVI